MAVTRVGDYLTDNHFVVVLIEEASNESTQTT
jgi:hypothetical protein